MTPKEKAEELVNKIMNASNSILKYVAIECAKRTVDEILSLEPPELSYLEPFSKSYWMEVRNELNKM